MVQNKVDIITLGCSKNLVDSEQLMRQLAANGYTVAHDADLPDGEIVVVNTCGFIGDAKAESIDMILQLVELKKKRKIKRLYVMGCLSGRYIKDLPAEIPEVDRFYGKFNWKELIADLGKSYDPTLANERFLTTPNHYAYIKVSEGCNRTCAYCAIPIITGRHVSRSIEEIEDEVRYLVGQGVKEFQIIAQDLTFYGLDLYKINKLPELVERLSLIEGVEWIRLHYAYPHNFPYDLLRVMRERPNVCNYLDIALQHIHSDVLKRMRRPVTQEQTIELIDRIRREVPGIHLRTTFMVGYPDESQEEFDALKAFVRSARFERMGAFIYSEEEDTYSAKNLSDNVPYTTKEARLDELMAIQELISLEISESKVGEELMVIIDRLEGDYYIARTEFDSPEVDPEVLIKATTTLQPGAFCRVRIVDAVAFDLYGELI